MMSLMLLKYPKLAGKKILSSIILFQVPGPEMVMSMSLDSSFRELKRYIIINYAKLNCVDLLACLRGRGNFLMNLSLGPGGNYRDASVNSPTIPRGFMGRGYN